MADEERLAEGLGIDSGGKPVELSTIESEACSSAAAMDAVASR